MCILTILHKYVLFGTSSSHPIVSFHANYIVVYGCLWHSFKVYSNIYLTHLLLEGRHTDSLLLKAKLKHSEGYVSTKSLSNNNKSRTEVAFTQMIFSLSCHPTSVYFTLLWITLHKKFLNQVLLLIISISDYWNTVVFSFRITKHIFYQFLCVWVVFFFNLKIIVFELCIPSFS